MNKTKFKKMVEGNKPFTQWLKDNGYKLWHARAAIDGVNTEYIKDGYSFKLDDLIKEWSKKSIKLNKS